MQQQASVPHEAEVRVQVEQVKQVEQGEHGKRTVQGPGNAVRQPWEKVAAALVCAMLRSHDPMRACITIIRQSYLVFGQRVVTRAITTAVRLPECEAARASDEKAAAAAAANSVLHPSSVMPAWVRLLTRALSLPPVRPVCCKGLCENVQCRTCLVVHELRRAYICAPGASEEAPTRALVLFACPLGVAVCLGAHWFVNGCLFTLAANPNAHLLPTLPASVTETCTRTRTQTQTHTPAPVQGATSGVGSNRVEASRLPAYLPPLPPLCVATSACTMWALPMMQTLLEAGADVNGRGPCGTPLSTLAGSVPCKCGRQYLGCDVKGVGGGSSRDGTDGPVPCHHVSGVMVTDSTYIPNGQVAHAAAKVFALLNSAGMDVDVRFRGKTPAEASKTSWPAMARVLLEPLYVRVEAEVVRDAARTLARHTGIKQAQRRRGSVTPWGYLSGWHRRASVQEADHDDSDACFNCLGPVEDIQLTDTDFDTLVSTAYG